MGPLHPFPVILARFHVLLEHIEHLELPFLHLFGVRCNGGRFTEAQTIFLRSSISWDLEKQTAATY